MCSLDPMKEEFNAQSIVIYHCQVKSTVAKLIYAGRVSNSFTQKK